MKRPTHAGAAGRQPELRQRIVETVLVSARELKRNPLNFRVHPGDQRGDVSRLLDEVGQVRAVLAVREADGTLLLVDGHLRADIADERRIRVDIADLSPDEVRLVLAMLDHTAGMAGVNLAKLQALVASVSNSRPEWKNELATAAKAMQAVARSTRRARAEQAPSITLAERFGVVPVSVIDTTADAWRQRRAAWVASGFDGVTDPVFIELALRWFCPPAGAVIDPFRGNLENKVVAGRLGCNAVVTAKGRGDVDLVLGVIPEPRRDQAEHGRWLHAVAQECETRLRTNRFLVWVFEAGRDPATGAIRGAGVAEAIAALQAAGLLYYNDVVLVGNAGASTVNLGNRFSTTRQIGRAHSTALVFFKGDPAAIKTEFPEIADAADLGA